jgi:hypothetical protein
MTIPANRLARQSHPLGSHRPKQSLETPDHTERVCRRNRSKGWRRMGLEGTSIWPDSPPGQPSIPIKCELLSQ